MREIWKVDQRSNFSSPIFLHTTSKDTITFPHTAMSIPSAAPTQPYTAPRLLTMPVPTTPKVHFTRSLPNSDPLLIFNLPLNRSNPSLWPKNTDDIKDYDFKRLILDRTPRARGSTPPTPLPSLKCRKDC